MPDQGAAGDAPGRVEHLELAIGGMTCPHCPQTLEKALEALPGVEHAHVNLANALATVDYDPARTRIADLLQRIRAAGFSAGKATIRIPVASLHCASCVTPIEGALRATPGVLAARVNPVTSAVDVEYQPEQTLIEDLHHAIERGGHRVAKPKAAEDAQAPVASPDEAAQREEYRTLMRKFWFAAVIALPVMGLSYPEYVPGLREWMPEGSAARRIVGGLLGLASLPVLLWSGSQVFTGMWAALKHRSANMHTLIAIGISAAFL